MWSEFFGTLKNHVALLGAVPRPQFVENVEVSQQQEEDDDEEEGDAIPTTASSSVGSEKKKKKNSSVKPLYTQPVFGLHADEVMLLARGMQAKQQKEEQLPSQSDDDETLPMHICIKNPVKAVARILQEEDRFTGRGGQKRVAKHKIHGCLPPFVTYPAWSRQRYHLPLDPLIVFNTLASDPDIIVYGHCSTPSESGGGVGEGEGQQQKLQKTQRRRTRRNSARDTQLPPVALDRLSEEDAHHYISELVTPSQQNGNKKRKNSITLVFAGKPKLLHRALGCQEDGLFEGDFQIVSRIAGCGPLGLLPHRFSELSTNHFTSLIRIRASNVVVENADCLGIPKYCLDDPSDDGEGKKGSREDYPPELTSAYLASNGAKNPGKYADFLAQDSVWLASFYQPVPVLSALKSEQRKDEIKKDDNQQFFLEGPKRSLPSHWDPLPYDAHVGGRLGEVSQKKLDLFEASNGEEFSFIGYRVLYFPSSLAILLHHLVREYGQVAKETTTVYSNSSSAPGHGGIDGGQRAAAGGVLSFRDRVLGRKPSVDGVVESSQLLKEKKRLGGSGLLDEVLQFHFIVSSSSLAFKSSRRQAIGRLLLQIPSLNQAVLVLLPSGQFSIEDHQFKKEEPMVNCFRVFRFEGTMRELTDRNSFSLVVKEYPLSLLVEVTVKVTPKKLETRSSATATSSQTGPAISLSKKHHSTDYSMECWYGGDLSSLLLPPVSSAVSYFSSLGRSEGTSASGAGAGAGAGAGVSKTTGEEEDRLLLFDDDDEQIKLFHHHPNLPLANQVYERIVQEDEAVFANSFAPNGRLQQALVNDFEKGALANVLGKKMVRAGLKGWSKELFRKEDDKKRKHRADSKKTMTSDDKQQLIHGAPQEVSKANSLFDIALQERPISTTTDTKDAKKEDVKKKDSSSSSAIYQRQQRGRLAAQLVKEYAPRGREFKAQMTTAAVSSSAANNGTREREERDVDDDHDTTIAGSTIKGSDSDTLNAVMGLLASDLCAQWMDMSTGSDDTSIRASCPHKKHILSLPLVTKVLKLDPRVVGRAFKALSAQGRAHMSVKRPAGVSNQGRLPKAITFLTLPLHEKHIFVDEESRGAVKKEGGVTSSGAGGNKKKIIKVGGDVSSQELEQFKNWVNSYSQKSIQRFMNPSGRKRQQKSTQSSLGIRLPDYDTLLREDLEDSSSSGSDSDDSLFSSASSSSSSAESSEISSVASNAEDRQEGTVDDSDKHARKQARAVAAQQSLEAEYSRLLSCSPSNFSSTIVAQLSKCARLHFALWCSALRCSRSFGHVSQQDSPSSPHSFIWRLPSGAADNFASGGSSSPSSFPLVALAAPSRRRLWEDLSLSDLIILADGFPIPLTMNQAERQLSSFKQLIETDHHHGSAFDSTRKMQELQNMELSPMEWGQPVKELSAEVRSQIDNLFALFTKNAKSLEAFVQPKLEMMLKALRKFGMVEFTLPPISLEEAGSERRPSSNDGDLQMEICLSLHGEGFDFLSSMITTASPNSALENQDDDGTTSRVFEEPSSLLNAIQGFWFKLIKDREKFDQKKMAETRKKKKKKKKKKKTTYEEGDHDGEDNREEEDPNLESTATHEDELRDKRLGSIPLNLPTKLRGKAFAKTLAAIARVFQAQGVRPTVAQLNALAVELRCRFKDIAAAFDVFRFGDGILPGTALQDDDHLAAESRVPSMTQLRMRMRRVRFHDNDGGDIINNGDGGANSRLLPTLQRRNRSSPEDVLDRVLEVVQNLEKCVKHFNEEQQAKQQEASSVSKESNLQFLMFLDSIAVKERSLLQRAIGYFRSYRDATKLLPLPIDQAEASLANLDWTISIIKDLVEDEKKSHHDHHQQQQSGGGDEEDTTTTYSGEFRTLLATELISLLRHLILTDFDEASRGKHQQISTARKVDKDDVDDQGPQQEGFDKFGRLKKLLEIYGDATHGNNTSSSSRLSLPQEETDRLMISVERSSSSTSEVAAGSPSILQPTSSSSSSSLVTTFRTALVLAYFRIVILSQSHHYNAHVAREIGSIFTAEEKSEVVNRLIAAGIVLSSAAAVKNSSGKGSCRIRGVRLVGTTQGPIAGGLHFNWQVFSFGAAMLRPKRRTEKMFPRADSDTVSTGFRTSTMAITPFEAEVHVTNREEWNELNEVGEQFLPITTTSSLRRQQGRFIGQKSKREEDGPLQQQSDQGEQHQQEGLSDEDLIPSSQLPTANCLLFNQLHNTLLGTGPTSSSTTTALLSGGVSSFDPISYYLNHMLPPTSTTTDTDTSLRHHHHSAATDTITTIPAVAQMEIETDVCPSCIESLEQHYFVESTTMRRNKVVENSSTTAATAAAGPSTLSDDEDDDDEVSEQSEEEEEGEVDSLRGSVGESLLGVATFRLSYARRKRDSRYSRRKRQREALVTDVTDPRQEGTFQAMNNCPHQQILKPSEKARESLTSMQIRMKDMIEQRIWSFGGANERSDSSSPPSSSSVVRNEPYRESELIDHYLADNNNLSSHHDLEQLAAELEVISSRKVVMIAINALVAQQHLVKIHLDTGTHLLPSQLFTAGSKKCNDEEKAELNDPSHPPSQEGYRKLLLHREEAGGSVDVDPKFSHGVTAERINAQRERLTELCDFAISETKNPGGSRAATVPTTLLNDLEKVKPASRPMIGMTLEDLLQNRSLFFDLDDGGEEAPTILLRKDHLHHGGAESEETEIAPPPSSSRGGSLAILSDAGRELDGSYAVSTERLCRALVLKLVLQAPGITETTLRQQLQTRKGSALPFVFSETLFTRVVKTLVAGGWLEEKRIAVATNTGWGWTNTAARSKESVSSPAGCLLEKYYRVLPAALVARTPLE